MRYQWYGGFESSGNTLAGLLETLEKVRNDYGTLEIINEQYKSGYPNRLTVEIDSLNKAYYPYKSGPEIDTLYYNNFDAVDNYNNFADEDDYTYFADEGDYTEVISGNIHNIFLIRDFDFMVGMVKEFWDTGDVKELKYTGDSRIDPDEEDDEDDDFDWDEYFDEIDKTDAHYYNDIPADTDYYYDVLSRQREKEPLFLDKFKDMPVPGLNKQGEFSVKVAGNTGLCRADGDALSQYRAIEEAIAIHGNKALKKSIFFQTVTGRPLCNTCMKVFICSADKFGNPPILLFDEKRKMFLLWRTNMKKELMSIQRRG